MPEITGAPPGCKSGTARVPTAICIGCGCDDGHRVIDGRTWEQVDRRAGVGICTVCHTFAREHGFALERIGLAFERLRELITKIRASGGFYRAR